MLRDEAVFMEEAFEGSKNRITAGKKDINPATSIERYLIQSKIAAVLFSAENKYYRDVTVDIPEHPSGKLQLYEEYTSFIHKELPAFISSHFHVSSRPEDTYIAGLSMGGYGTAYHALLHPERFCAIGIFSGLVFQRKYCFWDTEKLACMSEKDKSDALLPELSALIEQNWQKKSLFLKYTFQTAQKILRNLCPYLKKIKAGRSRYYN